MKQFPKLTVVGKEAEGEQADGASSVSRVGAAFELVALDSLEADEKVKIQSSVQEILPKAAILGVAKTPRLWDLRPVVAFGGEESPSIVRFVGPGVTAVPHLAARVREIYDRLREQTDLHSGVLGCGTLRGEFWYRRPLAESTLAHILSSAQALTDYQVFSIAYRLVEELSRWHERGIVHAHISSSNIWVAPQGRVFLFDPFLGLATIQANRGKTDYNLQSFAPELLRNETATAAADVYGLGLVFRRLFLGLAKRIPYEANREKVERQVRPFLDLSEAMLQPEANGRPGLSQVRRFVADAYQGFQKEAEESLKKRKSDTSHKQGKIVKANPAEAPESSQRSSGSRSNLNSPVAETKATSGTQAAVEEKKELQNATAIQAAPQSVTPQSIPPQGITPQDPSSSGSFSQPGYSQTQNLPPQNVVPPMGPGYIYPAGAAPYTPPSGYGAPSHLPPQQAHPYPYPGQPLPGHPAAYHPYAPQPHAYHPYAATHPVYTGVPPHMVGPQAVPPQATYVPNPGIAVDSSARHEVPARKDSSLFGLSVVLVGLLAGFWYVRTHNISFIAQQEENVSDDLTSSSDVRQAWQSHIPSRMIPVAELALSNSELSKAAQSVILESAFNGEQGLVGVNVSMLRVAFDNAWESELSIQDRRSALAMGLAGLLKDRFPKDLQRVDGLHPGVILAATANAGKSASHILSGVPASMLTRLLPAVGPAFGPAFQELVKGSPNLNCGDDAVRRLARLGTNNAVDGLEDLTLFLKTESGALREDAPVRLRAMAVLFANNNGVSNALLQVLLKHPTLSVDVPAIKWANQFELSKWKELEAGDKMFVLAGVAPAGTIVAENLGKLFAHPSAEMRAYALSKAINRLPMKHPGAIEVFRILQSDPDLLTPDQLVNLMYLLKSPQDQQMATIQSWLSTNPPSQIVAPLLLSTASASSSTPLDTAFAVYLKANKWKPEVGVLRKLSQHPDSYTRLFAYNELYMMDDRETSREFLAAAIRRETNKDNLDQLHQMLNDLTGQQ